MFTSQLTETSTDGWNAVFGLQHWTWTQLQMRATFLPWGTSLVTVMLPCSYKWEWHFRLLMIKSSYPLGRYTLNAEQVDEAYWPGTIFPLKILFLDNRAKVIIRAASLERAATGNNKQLNILAEELPPDLMLNSVLKSEHLDTLLKN